MDEKTQKAIDDAKLLISHIAVVADYAQKAIPDLFQDTRCQVGYFTSDHTSEATIDFVGGNNADCQKLVGLIISKMIGILPDIQVYVSYKEPYGEPSIKINRENVKRLTPEVLGKLEKKFDELHQLTREKFKEEIQQFALSRLVMKTTDKSNQNAIALLTYMKEFIKLAGSNCVADIKPDSYPPGSVTFTFSDNADCVKLAGTVATKLSGLQSLRLEFENISDTKCSLVLKQQEVENISQADLAKTKQNLCNTRKSAGSLNKEIAGFDIVKYFHFIEGKPAPRARSR